MGAHFGAAASKAGSCAASRASTSASGSGCKLVHTDVERGFIDFAAARERHENASNQRRPLAYKNEEFLDSDDARPLRILAEYLAPLEAFHRERIRDTIVFFGSARLAPGRSARPLLRGGARAGAAGHRVVEEPPVARRTATSSASGGGGGIMEAANRGASEAAAGPSASTSGCRTSSGPTRTSRASSAFEFHYFFMRKLWFAHLARALVVFPGGFGTLDELIEILTLQQTGKLDAAHRRSCSTGRAYWKEIINFEALVRHGMIAREDLDLFTFADDPDTALGLLQRWLRPEPEGVTPAFADSRTSGAGVGDAPAGGQDPSRP